MRERLVVARQIARNLRAARRAPGAGDLASGSELSPTAAAAYADGAWASLVHGAGRAPATFAGARVLEVGPGDNLALGLRMVAAGAGEVVAVDRFAVAAPAERQAAVYAALIERLSDDGARARAEQVFRPGQDPPLDPGRVRLVGGVGAEDAARALVGDSGFDIVISIAALQHTADLEASLRSLDALLRPGGVMAHQVDLGDMGMFSGRGLHPLTFLTIPDRSYRMMGSRLGIPNRGLVDSYRRVLGGLGYEVELKITRIVGETEKLEPYRSELTAGRDFSDRHVALVDEIRPRMLARYRSLPAEDLLAQSALIVARKPYRS